MRANCYLYTFLGVSAPSSSPTLLGTGETDPEELGRDITNIHNIKEHRQELTNIEAIRELFVISKQSLIPQSTTSTTSMTNKGVADPPHRLLPLPLVPKPQLLDLPL